MAITDEDKQKLADLVMRAFDAIAEDYGDDAELVTGILVYEVRVPDTESKTNDWFWHGNFEGMNETSPHHISGLLETTAQQIKDNFVEEDEDE